MTWRYLLCINDSKYPKVCEALDKAKEKESIASYIRKLVEQDIEFEENILESKRAKMQATPQLPVFAEIAVAKETQFESQQPEPIKIFEAQDVDDDFGGGLA
jgi:uncharacterized protein YehS (DUF1456 family)